MGCVYKATNVINGKIYIGLTENDLETRKKQHSYRMKLDTSRHNVFYNALRKHGFEAFEWCVLESANTLEELGALEKKYINELNALDTNIGYNVKEGGESGGKWSEEHRNKIGESRGQKPFYVLNMEGQILDLLSSASLAAEKYKVSRPNIGKCLNNEIHQSNGFLFIFKDSLTKEVIYDKIKYSNKQNRKSFYMINRHTQEVIAEFDTKTAAAKFIGGDPVSIGKVVNGKKEYYKDYVFKYKEG